MRGLLIGRICALAASLFLCTAAFAADPQISSFVDSPDPVSAGGKVTYTARAINSALDDAVNVVLSVPVPSGAAFVSASAPCVLAGATVRCSLGTLGGVGTDVRDFDFVFRALNPGPSVLTATASVTADNDSNAANNTASQTTTVISGGDLSLSKTATPSPVISGAQITYTLTASNAGPNASGDIVITDALPPAVTYVSSTGSGWSCSQSANLVTCTHAGPHAANVAIPSLSIVGTVTASSGTVTNAATVAPAASGGIADPDLTNNTASVSTPVVPAADLAIASKSVTSASPATAGTIVTFRIQPRNNGPVTAVNAVVTDVLPAGWTYVSASGPNWSCGDIGQSVTCARASFPVSATDDITVSATAPSNAFVGAGGTSYSNTATIASDTVDSNPSNNSASVGIVVRPDGADLRLSKSTTPNPVAVGGTLTSTIVVSNSGPRIATGPLRVVELLSNETFVSASGSGWTCVPNGSTLVCTNSNAGGLAVNDSLPNLVITALAPAGGAATNVACTGSSVPPGVAAGTAASAPVEGDPNPANDCSSVSATATVIQPDLAITKTTTTPSGGDKIVSVAEASVTYTLVVSNVTAPGTDAATGTVIKDTVPAYIGGRTTISPVTATVSAGTATFNCAVAAAVVTCTQTGGLLAPGQTVTVPIIVNRPMLDGTFTNTATVSNTAEGDPVAANNSASDTVRIDPIADVEVTGKSVTPGSVRAGEPTTYVISYRNNGPSPALGVTLSDVFVLPAGDSGGTIQSIASSKPGATCSLGVGDVLTPLSPSLTCVIGTLANSETQTITLVLRPNFLAGTGSRLFTNTAAISTTTPQGPAGSDANDSKQATLTVMPPIVDLLVNKIDYVDPVAYVGHAFMDYRVAITNNGPSYATNVRVAESMLPPAGKRVHFVCDTSGPASAVCNVPSLCSSTDVVSPPGTAIPGLSCTLGAGTVTSGLLQGELAVGQTKYLYLRFEAVDQPAAVGDTFANSVTVSSNEPDSFAANNSTTEQTTVRQFVDLAVTKTPSLATVSLRQPFNWVLTVTNNGSGDSAVTDLIDALPAGLTVTGVVAFSTTLPASSGTCSATAAQVSCALGRLNNGGVATVTIPVRVDVFPASGGITNTATLDTDPNKLGGVDPVTANNSATSTVGVVASSVGGVVFEDLDRTGSNGGTPQSAATEPRIANASITLSGIDAYGNSVNVSTATDASGSYSFVGLSPANAAGYSVALTPPAGYSPSPSNPPAAGVGSPSAGGIFSSTNAAYATVVLPANSAAVNYNFPEIRVQATTISGSVYVDRNRNGTMDATPIDSRIAGVTIRLVQGATCASGLLLQSQTTGADGSYAFSGIAAGQAVLLCETQPVGYGDGSVNPGTGASAAGANTISIPNLAATGSAANNFGERLASISGNVFLDANNDGLRAGDTGIAGVAIALNGVDALGNVVARTTVTDATGSWRFDDLLAAGPLGYSIVEQTAQPTFAGVPTLNGKTVPGSAGGVGTPVTTVPSSIDGVHLPPGADSTENNFAELALPSSGVIAGRVWLDLDGNGAIGVGESGIPGVSIELSGVDIAGQSVSRSTVTDVAGNFSFANLAPGNYALREPTQPVNTLNGATLAGSGGGSASAIATTPSSISAITLASNQSSVENDFGEIPAAQIAGRVYADNNDNGVPDSGESGIGNVVLTLTGVDDRGNAVNTSVTTDSNGNYSFTNLRPGTYTVTEALQPAGTLNGATSPGTINGATVGTGTSRGTTPSAISAIVLPTGASSIANNFAELTASPDLRVSKSSVDAHFTVNNVGAYRIQVRNAGQVATSGQYVVSDRLPSGLTLATTPTGIGWVCQGAAGASVFTCSSSATLAPGATNPNAVTASVQVGAAALQSSPVTNVVLVEGGGEIDAYGPTPIERSAFNGDPASLPACDPSIANNACRQSTVVQASASLSGTVWYDIGTTSGQLDAGDTRLASWNVEVLDSANKVVARATTSADGTYRVDNLIPGVPLTVQFRDPQSNVVWGYPVNGESGAGSSGTACGQATAIASGGMSSCAAPGGSPALVVVLGSGRTLPQQSLPVNPGGVVYDSGSRAPVPGAVVTLSPSSACAGWDPSTSIAGAALGGYTVNGSSISMTTGTLGIYQFAMSTAAPASCTFSVNVTPPSGYQFVSTLIPPSVGPLSPPGAAGLAYAVQPQGTAPNGAIGPATTYYLTFVTGSSRPAIVHDHLPLDPAAPTGLTLTKTGDKQVAEIGDSVRYTLTVNAGAGPLSRQVTIVDRLPAGFTYIDGTAVVNGKSVSDPVGKPGPLLAFNLGAMSASGPLVLQYRARVGVGSQQGDGVNVASGFACGVPTGCVTPGSFTPLQGVAGTNEARYRVRVSGGVFTTDACMAGKIFVDCNNNHVQDTEELGIPGVRLVLSDGTTLVSDSEGKYSMCGLSPRSMVLRVDDSTLPRKSRLTTSSNRNLGDAGSLWLDLKSGELDRADFIEGSCSNTVLDQVKARRAQGEVRSVETEKKKSPALRFDSKAHGLDALTAPRQGTDSANQKVPKVRDTGDTDEGSKDAH